MKKTDWQYLVDTLLFICIVGIAIIGFLMGLVIPKGPKAAESAKYFLGLHRHQWGNIHFYLSIAFVTLIVLHLILSWSWIKGKARQIFNKIWATVLAFTVVLSLLVLFLFWILYPRRPGAYEDHGVRSYRRAKEIAFEKKAPHEEKIFPDESQEHVAITGQMTLLDVEKSTGIPARKIADALGLPAKVSLDEPLGRLRKRHLFTMQQVRNIVTSLMKKAFPFP